MLNYFLFNRLLQQNGVSKSQLYLIYVLAALAAVMKPILAQSEAF